jgi:hypothetical protein
MPAGLLSQAVLPGERSIAAAPLLAETVDYYPWPLVLHLLRAPAQGFQLMLNTELISYVSLIFRYGD